MLRSYRGLPMWTRSFASCLLWLPSDCGSCALRIRIRTSGAMYSWKHVQRHRVVFYAVVSRVHFSPFSFSQRNVWPLISYWSAVRSPVHMYCRVPADQPTGRPPSGELCRWRRTAWTWAAWQCMLRLSSIEVAMSGVKFVRSEFSGNWENTVPIY